MENEEYENEKITFGESIANYFKGYFKFRGYTSRREFWLTMVLLIPVQIVLVGLMSFLAITLITSLALQGSTFDPGTNTTPLVIAIILISIILLLLFFPTLTMQIRRFRDTGIKALGYVVYVLLGYLASLMLNNANGYNLDGSVDYSPLWLVYGIIVAGIGIYIYCQPADKFVTSSTNKYVLWFLRSKDEPREEEPILEEFDEEVEDIEPYSEVEIQSETVSETTSETSETPESQSSTESEATTESASESEVKSEEKSESVVESSESSTETSEVASESASTTESESK